MEETMSTNQPAKSKGENLALIDFEFLDKRRLDYIKKRDGWKPHTSNWEVYDLMVRELVLIINNAKPAVATPPVSEVSDEEIETFALNEKYKYTPVDSGMSLYQDGIVCGAKWIRSRLSAKQS